MNRTTNTQRWVLGLSALASFMVVLDMLVVATALPTIQRDLDASQEALEWTINAYTLSFAVLLMTGAAVGDRFGRRLGFVAGLAVFAIASAACALAPSAGVLVAARAVQGAGAALVMPLALALMNAAFPPERRGWATGVYGGVTGLAATVGPIIGGVLTQTAGWAWVFWINVPIGLLAIPLVLTRTPESHGTRTAFDLPGIVLGALAALGLVWGLIRGNTAGWTSVATLVPLAAGLVAGVVFVAVERRRATPMLPPRLFASRSFSAGNAAIFLLNAGLTGGLVLTAQFFQLAGGLGALDAGLRMLPLGIVPMLVGSRAGALADRFGERNLIVAGSFVMAAGLAWQAAATTPDVAYWSLLGPLVLVGLGIALGVPAMTRAVVSHLPMADLAKASGTFSTLRQLGGAFGVAALGAVFAATGGYGTPATFTGGAVPALATGAALACAATIAGLTLPSRQAAAVPAAA